MGDVAGSGNFRREFNTAFPYLDIDIIAIQRCDCRERAYLEMDPERRRFGTAVHPTACVDPTAKIGAGTIIMQLSTVGHSATLSPFVVIDKQSAVGHDTEIGQFSTLAPGAVISGHCKIGRRVYVGSNASIKENVSICDDVTIGMGAVVVKDITEPGSYVGVPAKRMEKDEV